MVLNDNWISDAIQCRKIAPYAWTSVHVKYD